MSEANTHTKAKFSLMDVMNRCISKLVRVVDIVSTSPAGGTGTASAEECVEDNVTSPPLGGKDAASTSDVYNGLFMESGCLLQLLRAVGNVPDPPEGGAGKASTERECVRDSVSSPPLGGQDTASTPEV